MSSLIQSDVIQQARRELSEKHKNRPDTFVANTGILGFHPVRGEMFIEGETRPQVLRSEERNAPEWQKVSLTSAPRTELMSTGILVYKHLTPTELRTLVIDRST